MDELVDTIVRKIIEHDTQKVKTIKVPAKTIKAASQVKTRILEKLKEENLPVIMHMRNPFSFICNWVRIWIIPQKAK